MARTISRMTMMTFMVMKMTRMVMTMRKCITEDNSNSNSSISEDTTGNNTDDGDDTDNDSGEYIREDTSDKKQHMVMTKRTCITEDGSSSIA